MRRLWILMAALMTFGALAVVAPGAGAASAPSPKFCAAVRKIGTGTGDKSSDPTALAKYASQFKTAGKSAPKNVKSAANTIASVLSKVKNYAKNPTDLAKLYSSSDFSKYAKSITTFFTYSAGCTSR
jgi:hypothetical protein